MKKGAAQTALFAGQIGGFGGLSNEDELVKMCPDEFREKNEWSQAMKFFNKEHIASENWKWRSSDQEERKKQLFFLFALCVSLDLSDKDKEAVAGWMASEIFSEIPGF